MLVAGWPEGGCVGVSVVTELPAAAPPSKAYPELIILTFMCLAGFARGEESLGRRAES
jgi:hypothetical protein